MINLTDTRLAKPILIATCGDDRKLYKTFEPCEDGTITAINRGGSTVTFPGPIGYIEYHGKISHEEPVFTSIKMVTYWEFSSTSLKSTEVGARAWAGGALAAGFL
jgi:hypothetical protein